MKRSDKIALTLLAIGLTFYAGAKHALPTFQFDSYLADAGSYATNDTVHVAFTQRAQGLDLAASPVLVYAREMAATNAADWSELSPRRMFPAFPADYTLANATNYNYAVYVDYVPPPTVHTNGVWQMRGIELARSESGTTVAFPNTTVKNNTLYDEEVEYLLSTGTQYINLGVVPGGCVISAVIQFSTVSVPTATTHGIIGSNHRDGSDNIQFSIFQNKWRVKIATTAVFGSAWDTARHTVRLNSSTGTYIDDTRLVGAQQTVPSANNQVMTLFAVNYDGRIIQGSEQGFYGKIYHCIVYSNGVVVRDLTPVRKGDVGYMFDSVTGQLLGNSGTDAFGVGPDIVRVEYLESDGGQYINTGFPLSSDCRVTSDFIAYPTNGSAYPFGVYGNSKNFGFNVATSGAGYATWYNVNNYSSSALSNYTGKRMSVDLSANGLYVDNAYILTPNGSFANTNPAYLFWANGTGQPKQKVRIYSTQFYDGTGALVRNFVPARVGRGLSWEGAMQDTLTRRIYRNAGTGSFGIGPDTH